MSSRVLRKLHGDGVEVAKIENEVSDPEPELAGTGGAKKKHNVNRYDLFNQLSQSESEVKEDDDDDNEPKILGATGAASTERVEGDITKRKKKKKKKKSVKALSNQKSSEDNGEVDEVERSVREVNKILGETWTAMPSSSAGDGPSLSRKGILNVEQRFLNPNNELKRIFGSKIVQNEISKRRSRGRGHVKSLWLVSPRENWAKVGKQGISMRLVEIKDGAQYFTFEHNSAYQHVQMVFLRAVNTLNPDNIVAVINGHPYHVDALLQLSDMCKMSEDLQMAAELNERVLFCLETAFHPSFNFALGTCRLDYRRQENRALFIALFKHLLFVGQRACYRTALELCKLLLSLDPAEDPMAIVLCVDFYALKAGEFEWLLKAGQEWETEKNIVQLPNFAYSLAVAQFYLSEEGKTEAADEMLQNALIMFPSVLVPLLEKCSIQPDPKVTSHPFFNVLTNPRERPALVQLVQLYIARSHHVWKDAALLPWLERNVTRVLERVDACDLLVADARDKRDKRYRKPPRAVVRHILLSDLKDVTVTLEENTEEAVLSYDPLPPLDAINLYTPPTRSRLHDNEGLFSVFFRSILPSFNVNEPAPVDGQLGRPRREEWVDEGGAVGPVADFQRSVVHLVDAVRDLISNINVRPADGAADADQEDDDDDDESGDEPDLEDV